MLAITAAIPQGSRFNKLVFRHFPAMFSGPAARNDVDADRLKARTEALQLLPPFVAASSPVAATVSGKTWQMPENADAIKSVSLTFADKRCTFTLEDSRGTHKVEVGLDAPLEGTTTMTGNKLHHEYQPDVMRVVASGAWRDLRTFVMTWTFVESAFRDTVTCTFEGPQMRLSRSVNVNSSALEMPTLMGKMT